MGAVTRKKILILFYLELAQIPIECIDYIVVHEMIHLLDQLVQNCSVSITDGINWVHGEIYILIYQLKIKRK